MLDGDADAGPLVRGQAAQGSISATTPPWTVGEITIDSPAPRTVALGLAAPGGAVRATANVIDPIVQEIHFRRSAVVELVGGPEENVS